MSTTSRYTDKPGIRRYVTVVISLLFGIFLLWLIGRGQNFNQIIIEFKNANYLWILMAVIASLASHLLRAMRWNLMIETMGFNPSTGKTFHALMAGYLSNLAVPRIGEITRCVLLGKLTRLPMNALLGTVVSERMFDMLTLLTLLLLTFFFQFEFLKGFMDRIFLSHLVEKGEENQLWLLLIALTGIVIMAAAFFFFRKKLTEPVKDGFYYRLKRQLSGLKFGLLTIYHMPRKGLFLLYSLLIWVLYFFTVYLCFFALEATSHLSVSAGITLLVVGSLGIVAPVPGGIGTYHFLTIVTLGELYLIAAEPAISYAYIAHATQMIVVLVTGAISWTIISLILKNESSASTSASYKR